MSAEHAPDAAQNPYNPFDETDRYRAFQNGWRAQSAERAGSALPFAEAESARAWLDGWRAALEARPKTERDDRCA